MSMEPVSVGINLGHDGGCALVKGSKVVAIAEERLNRTRYSPGWHCALSYCLEAANVNLADVDIVVLSCVGPRLMPGFTAGLDRLGVPESKVTSVDHHVSHAYSTFCLSPFDQALVVVADGAGNDRETESYFMASLDALDKVGGNRPGRERAGGIGATYEAFTNFIGFHEQEAGKTMALAAYGDPNAFSHPLFDLAGSQVEGRLPATHERGLIDFAAAAGVTLGPRHQVDDLQAMNLAAWVQRETETVLIRLIGELAAQHRTRNVCLAGGVAMNCVANQALRRVLDIDVFVTPPASDRGQALGNALYGMHQLTGTVPRLRLDCDTFGRSYGEAEIQLALRRHPASGLVQRHPRHSFAYAPESDPALAGAQLLADGKLVGWFEGGSELGARALGRRSILADPRTAATRDSLNKRIKHREWFRPFAPAVVDEQRNMWFALDQPSPFMLYAATVLEEQRDRLGAVTHVDGSARVQTVDNATQPLFHRLIKEFGLITGVPVVLNTSFNDCEPIVETPTHALATFCATNLDALIIGNFVVVKDDQ